MHYRTLTVRMKKSVRQSGFFFRNQGQWKEMSLWQSSGMRESYPEIRIIRKNGTIENEELPVATELFRGCFNEAILDVAGRPGSYECVGDFFVKCYEEYLSHIEVFSVYVDAIAAYDD